MYANAVYYLVREGLRRGEITVHGFRSAFRDWTEERTNYPREVAEQALAHTIGTAVERAYRRTDLFEKRRRLMEEWAAFCASPAATGDVVPLRARGA
jgi:integrase